MTRFGPNLHSPYPWTSKVSETVAIKAIARDVDALREMMPAELELLEEPVVWLWLIAIPKFAGCGGYNELIVSVPCRAAGQIFGFSPVAYVTNDAAMASGRERMGVPKRIAAIDIALQNDQLLGTVTRSGVQFATLGMTLEKAATEAEVAKYRRGLYGKSLGFIDSVGAKGEIERRWLQGTLTGQLESVIKGRGFVDIRPSASDPLYLLDLRAVSALHFTSVDNVLSAAVPVDIHGGA